MFLFGKKNVKKAEVNKSLNQDSKIKVLGSGCKKCNALEESVVEAIKELGYSDQVDHVTDFAQIAKYGVMTTPALMVDGQVVSTGKVLSKDEAIEALRKVRG